MTEPVPDIPARSSASAGRRLNSEERKAALLDAAATLIRERGVEGLTMEGLATACNVNKALPYRHFANRDDVLVGLFLHESAEFDAHLGDDAVEAASFADAIARLVRLWHESVLAGRSTPELQHARTRSGTLETLRSARLQSSVAYIADLIQMHHDLDRSAAQLAASVLLAGSQGLAAVWRTTDADPEALNASFVAMSVGAVEAIAAP